MSAIDTIVSQSRPNKRPTATFMRRFGAALLRTTDSLDRMMDRRRSRLALLEMTDDQLKDVGLSRGEAYREGIRPFWD
ncbi:MAG: DUF1127 domain-containing protein [Rhizobiaceae bacterium]|nr:DUF1127 domain-containing protein [Rhizobiaceae bacterium]